MWSKNKQTRERIMHSMPTFNTWHSSILDCTNTLWSALDKYWSLIPSPTHVERIWCPVYALCTHTCVHADHEKWSVWSVSVCGSERLTQLLSNGENPSPGTVDAKQCNVSNNRSPPFYSQPHPLSERERACDSSTYCITTRGDDTNPDNFHHHGWEQLGLVINEILLLKYSQW